MKSRSAAVERLCLSSRYWENILLLRRDKKNIFFSFKSVLKRWKNALARIESRKFCNWEQAQARWRLLYIGEFSVPWWMPALYNEMKPLFAFIDVFLN